VIHMTNTNPCVVNTIGMTDDEVNERIKAGTWEICEYCKCVFIWEKLPDEKVLTSKEPHEFWGDPCYESIVEGFICPECGYKTDF
jgi:hypothetical protein